MRAPRRVCRDAVAAILLRRGGGRLVAVQLQDVVAGGDESPLGSARGSAAALEASHLAVELQLTEDRLDRGLSSPVERAAVWGGENATHEVIEPTGPARPCSATQARVGCDEHLDEHLDAVADDRLDLALMPVAARSRACASAASHGRSC